MIKLLLSARTTSSTLRPPLFFVHFEATTSAELLCLWSANTPSSIATLKTITVFRYNVIKEVFFLKKLLRKYGMLDEFCKDGCYTMPRLVDEIVYNLRELSQYAAENKVDISTLTEQELEQFVIKKKV